MATYSKETALYDTGAIGAGIAGAENNGKKEATNYIYAGSDGIKIAKADPEHADTYQKQTADSTEFYVDGVKRSSVSGSGFDVFAEDGSTKNASFGATAVISSEDANTSSSIKIEPSEISIWKNGDKRGVIAGEPFGDLENPIFFGKLYDYSYIEDGMYCAKSAVVISSSKRTGVDSEQRSTISITPDSININSLTVDGDGTIRTHKNSMKTLWSGAWFMDASHTVTLSEKVSEQLTGIVLVWSYYTDGAAQNYGWHTTFVPKAMVQLHSGVGYDIPLRRTKNAAFGTKYVYVNDDRIVGHADNVATGTANNVPYANNHWVLRYVFGC